MGWNARSASFAHAIGPVQELQQVDPGKRGELMAKVMQFYHDEATALYLYDRVQIDGLAANVRNYQVVDRTINWHEIELAN